MGVLIKHTRNIFVVLKIRHIKNDTAEDDCIKDSGPISKTVCLIPNFYLHQFQKTTCTEYTNHLGNILCKG